MRNPIFPYDKKISFYKQFTLNTTIRVSFSITYRTLLKSCSLLLLLFYWGWELYWYRNVGLAFVKWHTHLMPYVTVILLALILLPASASEPAKKAVLVLCSVFFSLFLIEAVLAASGCYKTYMERVTGAYYSMYETHEKSYYHVWHTPGQPHWLTKEEYSYWRPTNMLGFADSEWQVPKSPSVKKILALGDSFTEGDGAPYDSSYVALLSQQLHQPHDSFYIMNGGICGSDPFDNYINYKDLLVPYRPDLIIQSFGSGDMIDDIAIRGGMERFQKDGSLKFRPAPWWEPIYALSYTSRIFFKLKKYNEFLRNQGLSASEKRRMDDSVKSLFAVYDKLCRENGARLVIVLHPLKGEIVRNKYEYDFTDILEYLASDTRIRVVDLLPLYRSYIMQERGDVGDYFWKKDGHHNSKGYKMMSETTLAGIRPLLADSLWIGKGENTQ